MPIGRDQRDRKRMAARSGGRESRTQFVGAGAVRRLHAGGGRPPERPDPSAAGPLPVHRPPGGRRPDLRQRARPDRPAPAVRPRLLRCGSRSPHDDVERQFYAPLPGDLRSPLERLRTIRGFTPRSLPAAVRRRPEPAWAVARRDRPSPGPAASTPLRTPAPRRRAAGWRRSGARPIDRQRRPRAPTKRRSPTAPGRASAGDRPARSEAHASE